MHIIKDVYAEVNFGDPNVNPIAKFDSVTKFVNLAMPIMMIAGSLITLFMLLYGSFIYLTSAGNPEKIKKSQSTLMFAVLGLFLVVASFVLTKIIGFILKVNMPL